jgi:CRP-like cAMP-binding protein
MTTLDSGLQQFPLGFEIFSENDHSTDMYIILKGKVKIYKTRLDNDAKMELDTLGPGQVIGEMSLISNEPRTATAVAHTDIEVKVVTQENFLKSTSAIPEWSMSLAKVLVRRLKNINKNIGEVLFNGEVIKTEDGKSTSLDLLKFNIENNTFTPNLLLLKGNLMKEDIDTVKRYIEEQITNKAKNIIFDFSNLIDIDKEATSYIENEMDRLKELKIPVRIHNVQFIQEKIKTNKAFQNALEVMLPPIETIEEGAYLINQGDKDNTMFVVKSGRFKITRRVNGKEVEFAEVGAGNVVGELGLISGRTRMASAKAVTKSTVYRIHADEFHNNHFNIPQWFLTILKQLVNRTIDAVSRLDEVCVINN